MKKVLGIAAMLLLIVCVSQAATVEYTAINMGGNAWQYDYVITNDTQYDIDLFDIYFDDGTYYQDLTFLSGPAGWDALVMQWSFTDPFTLTGLADTPLLQYESAGIFSVTFNWAGDGAPGEQAFALFNSAYSWEDPLAGGSTSESPSPVPEPQTFMLLGTGLMGLAAYYRRTRNARKR
jgi:hypothetical protein